MARVLHLFQAPKRRAPMEELASAEVVNDAGFEGCAHARPGNRQVLVDAETLGAFQLEPGIIPENVTSEGLDVDGLAIAPRLRPAQVALEVSAVCDPCEQLAALRPGLRAEMQGRRAPIS